MEIELKFKHCAELIKTRNDVSDEDLAILYGNYKQALFGDNKSDRPLFLYFTAVAKWDAWTLCLGKSKEDAMKDYIAKVEQIFASQKV